MCQVPVSIDYHVHHNVAKPVWIVSVMIRTKTMPLILKKKKRTMLKLQTPVEARRSRKKKRRKKKVKTAKRRSNIVMRQHCV